MDFSKLLNEESVDPTPSGRRFSHSQTPLSAVESPVQNGSFFAGIKRPMSSSTLGEEPSPKKIMVKRKRPLAKPQWAHRWTEAWHQQYGGRNGIVSRPSASNGTQMPAPPSRADSQAGLAQPTSQPINLTQHGSVASSHPPSGAPSRPEPSYIDTWPQDELSRSIADYVYSDVIGPGWLADEGLSYEVEIEAKLGNIIDKGTNERIRLPVLHECALNDRNLHIAFRSSMTREQHRAMNDHLNKAVQQSLPRKDSNQPPTRQPMGYKHLYELDKFYQLTNTTYAALPPRLRSLVQQAKQKPRVRVTWNTKTDQIIAKIIKVRLSDLHVYNPKTAFDWRVSISLEVQYDGEVNSLIPADDAGKARNGRAKDRMSYTHQGVRIDLTQVTMTKEDDSGKAPPEKEYEHELELELPVGLLKEEAAKLPADGEGFKSLITLFVNDIRMATRQFPA